MQPALSSAQKIFSLSLSVFLLDPEVEQSGTQTWGNLQSGAGTRSAHLRCLADNKSREISIIGSRAHFIFFFIHDA